MSRFCHAMAARLVAEGSTAGGVAVVVVVVVLKRVANFNTMLTNENLSFITLSRPS